MNECVFVHRICVDIGRGYDAMSVWLRYSILHESSGLIKCIVVCNCDSRGRNTVLSSAHIGNVI